MFSVEAVTYEECEMEFTHAQKKLRTIHHNAGPSLLRYAYTMKSRLWQIKMRWEYILCDPRYAQIRETITKAVFDMFQNFNEQVEAYYNKNQIKLYQNNDSVKQVSASTNEPVVETTAFGCAAVGGHAQELWNDTSTHQNDEDEEGDASHNQALKSERQARFHELRQRLDELDKIEPKSAIKMDIKVELYKLPEYKRAGVPFIKLPMYEDVYEVLELFTKQRQTNIAIQKLFQVLAGKMNCERKLKSHAPCLLECFDNLPAVGKMGCQAISEKIHGSYLVFQYALEAMKERLNEMKKLPSAIKPKWLLAYIVQCNMLERNVQKSLVQDMFANALLPFLYKFTEEYYYNIFEHEYSRISGNGPRKFEFSDKLYQQMFALMGKGALFLGRNYEQIIFELRSLYFYGPSLFSCC